MKFEVARRTAQKLEMCPVGSRHKGCGSVFMFTGFLILNVYQRSRNFQTGVVLLLDSSLQKMKFRSPQDLKRTVSQPN